MFDLTEIPEKTYSRSFDPFYTHDDGTHWVHSSLYVANPCVNCWFTPDALVVWHPEVFEYDHRGPVSPLLKFPTFAPKNPDYTLTQRAGAAWVVGAKSSYEEDGTYGYVFVNSWGKPSDCIGYYKSVLSEHLEHLGIVTRRVWARRVR